jgi:hypothetical protein
MEAKNQIKWNEEQLRTMERLWGKPVVITKEQAELNSKRAIEILTRGY